MRGIRLAAIAVLLLTGYWAQAQQAQESTSPGNIERGRLLYENACGQCHTTQPHWRERHLVRSWSDLVFQVDRWQRIAGQNWRDADVQDVASYLNERFYHLSCPSSSC